MKWNLFRWSALFLCLLTIALAVAAMITSNWLSSTYTTVSTISSGAQPGIGMQQIDKSSFRYTWGPLNYCVEVCLQCASSVAIVPG